MEEKLRARLGCKAKLSEAHDEGQGGDQEPGQAGDAAGAGLELAGGLEVDPQRAVEGQGEEGEEAHQDGVPVENASTAAGLEIGPQGQEELVVGIQRDAADDVAESGAKEDGEQGAGQREDDIPEGDPDAVPRSGCGTRWRTPRKMSSQSTIINGR